MSTFTKTEIVEILSGKYRGQTGEVLATRTDKNGIERVQVKVGGGIFSYMIASLKGNTGVLGTTGVTEIGTGSEAVAEAVDEDFSFGKGF